MIGKFKCPICKEEFEKEFGNAPYKMSKNKSSSELYIMSMCPTCHAILNLRFKLTAEVGDLLGCDNVDDARDVFEKDVLPNLIEE